MDTLEVVRIFQKDFDTVMNTPLSIDEKLRLITDVLCSFLGHTSAMIYFLDPALYNEKEKGLACIIDLMKFKISESAKRQIESITLINTPPQGEA